MPEPTSSPTRQTSLARRLLLVCAVMLIGAGLCEVGARVRMQMKYGRTTTEIYDKVMDPVTGVNAPVPSQDCGFLHINALGFRGPEIAVQNAPGSLRIAYLGGSTTFCAEASSDAATWPALVTAELAKSTGVPCDYVNAALPGIGLKELRRILEFRVARLKPDVIVIYEATNDLSRDTRLLAEQRGLFTPRGDERSLLARISVAWDLIEKNLRVGARKRDAVANEGRLEFDADQLAEGFRSELEVLVDEAKAVAPVVVLVTFSTRMRAAQTPEQQLAGASTSLLYMPYMSIGGLLRGFAAYNRVIRDVAAAKGVVLVDGEESIPGDGAHFNDSVHFTDAGCKKQAERVSAVIAREHVMQAIREPRK
jgi:lysophospholipase L1-like esterase